MVREAADPNPAGEALPGGRFDSAVASLGVRQQVTLAQRMHNLVPRAAEAVPLRRSGVRSAVKAAARAKRPIR
eukprot:3073340-Prymnesium_polylepis.1